MDMSWREFPYWNAYLQLEPPDRGDNQRTAALMAQITNMSGKSLKEGKTVSPDEFLGKTVKKQSMEDQIAYMKSLSNSK